MRFETQSRFAGIGTWGERTRVIVVVTRDGRERELTATSARADDVLVALDRWRG